MASQPIAVGIISPLKDTRASWRTLLESTHVGAISVEGNEYGADSADRAIRPFVEAKPDVILVDMQDAQAALQTLRLLHEALPRTWLLVSSASADSQLIIETMRAGAREFLPHPVSLPDLAAALSRYVLESKKAEEKKHRGKIYSVTSAKGGAGTTSVAINLAFALAAARTAKVALLDLGYPIGDAAEYVNIKSHFTIDDALASAPRLDTVLLESYMSHSNNVALLPGRREFHSEATDPEALAAILQVAAESYTHVFIDMFCAHDLELLRLLTTSSEAIIVVITPELPSIWHTDRLIRRYEEIGVAEKLRLVLNRDSKRHHISSKEIEKMLHLPVSHRLPNNYPAAIEAVNTGKPVVIVNNSPLAASYIELAQELTGIQLGKKNRGLGLF
jgi:pilus assembly protein CpaE